MSGLIQQCWDIVSKISILLVESSMPLISRVERRVLPSIYPLMSNLWASYADTERNLRCIKYRDRISCFFSWVVGIVYNLIPISIS